MLRRSKDKSLAAGTGVLKILAPPKKNPRYICYSMQKIIVGNKNIGLVSENS